MNRIPGEHAGGKWRLTYESAAGRSGILELDVNFLLRTPLWPVLARDSRRIGTYQATQVPMMDLHELAGGKLAALLSRAASRDLFDACELLRRQDLDRTKLRLAFVVYGGASRTDWRTVSLDDVKLDANEFQGKLLPLLPRGAGMGSKMSGSWKSNSYRNAGAYSARCCLSLPRSVNSLSVSTAAARLRRSS